MRIELPGHLLWVSALPPVAQAIGLCPGTACLTPADD